MPTATATRVSALDLLSELPPKTRYLVSSRETKDLILKHFGILLGQELAGSAADGVEVDEYVKAISAQQLDVRKSRLEVQKLIEKFHFHESHHATSGKGLAAAQKELDKAQAAYLEAQDRLNQAQAAHHAAEQIDNQVQAAAVDIGTRCHVRATALEVYLQLKQ